MSKFSRAVAVFALLLIVVVSQSAVAQVKIIPHIGFSKDMRSETSNRWKMGLNAGAYVFLSLPSAASIGARVAYHSWEGDPDGWKEDFYSGSEYRMDKFSGSQSVIEVMPTIRLSLSPSVSPVQVALQGGAGLLFIGESDVTIGVSYSRPGVSGYEETTFNGESLTGFGGQLSLTLGLGRFELLPIYTLYLAGGNTYHHIAFVVGIAIP